MPQEKAIYKRMSLPVKFFSRDRGYGFLKRDKELDVFFTAKQLERAGIANIKENDVLEFDLVPVPGKGGKAINLKAVKA